MTERLRIIVAGMAGLYPVGGVAWDYLQYVIGFAAQGHDVYYYEDTSAWPYDPDRRSLTADGTYSASFLGDFFDRYAPDLADHWQYVHLHDQPFGMTTRQFSEIARTADLFVNVSGASMIPDDLGGSARRAFVDTDPGYNQILYLTRPAWSPNVERWCQLVDAHDRHLTYAENVGGDTLLPATGHDWQPTRMPVVIELWETARTTPGRTWTTVTTWNDFKGPLMWRGTEYGSKDREFERLIGLPSHVDVPLTIALGGRGAPAERLEASGWAVLDAPQVTRSPAQYRTFLASSRGEVSAAKHVYVALRTGWFSCRTACYLASGAPAVVQDTGFTSRIPRQPGLIPFAALAEAADGIREVEAQYVRHSDGARDIARAWFDSRVVLADLVNRCGTVPVRPLAARELTP